nr:heteromeric transposase endonuclease subunit TnsA [Vibrio anguillarum]
MAKSKYAPSETKYKRWIKEGRGNGCDSGYLPWITVRDVPSDGRSHRVFGHKSQRTHHLLSD